MSKYLIFSPHLDDAVLSFGQFISGQRDTMIVTVFAGEPDRKDLLTAYDAKTGYGTSSQVMKLRQQENIVACNFVGAEPVHLKFTDRQYDEPRDREHILEAMKQQVRGYKPDIIVAPLGLMHEDHVLTRELAIEVATKAEKVLFLYEDLPYRITNPDAVYETKQLLQENGYKLTFDQRIDIPLDKKAGAVMAYKTQLGGDINLFNVLIQERFYHVSKG